MYRFDRIGTPPIHRECTIVTSAGVLGNSTAHNNRFFTGQVVNATPGSIAGAENIHWTGALTLPINTKWIIGQQFNMTKKGPDNSQGLELTSSLYGAMTDCIDVVPICGELNAAAGAVLGNVDTVDVPLILGPSTARPGTTIRTRSVQFAGPVNLVSSDLTGTWFNGFLFSIKDAAAGTIDNLSMRFAFRTGEPDPNTRDFDIRR